MNAYSELSSCIAQFIWLNSINSGARLEIWSDGLDDPIKFCFSATLPRSDAGKKVTEIPPTPSQDQGLESPLHVPVDLCASKKRRKRKRCQSKKNEILSAEVDSPSLHGPDGRGLCGTRATESSQPSDLADGEHCPAEPPCASLESQSLSDPPTSIDMTVLWKSSMVEFTLPAEASIGTVKTEAMRLFGMDQPLSTLVLLSPCNGKIYHDNDIKCSGFGKKVSFRIDFCT